MGKVRNRSSELKGTTEASRPTSALHLSCMSEPAPYLALSHLWCQVLAACAFTPILRKERDTQRGLVMYSKSQTVRGGTEWASRSSLSQDSFLRTTDSPTSWAEVRAG